MDFSRFKAYDYGVMGLFILTIIGVSLDWYTASLAGFEISEKIDVLKGWDSSLGVLAFVMAFIALVWVGMKAVVTSRGSVPYWYLEGLVLMVLGGLIAIFTLIRILDKPSTGGALGLNIGYGAGIFITLIAGLLILGCGYLAIADRSMRPSPTAHEDDFLGMGRDAPPPARRGARHCQNCGAPVDPGTRFCRTCGKPQ